MCRLLVSCVDFKAILTPFSEVNLLVVSAVFTYFQLSFSYALQHVSALSRFLNMLKKIEVFMI